MRTMANMLLSITGVNLCHFYLISQTLVASLFALAAHLLIYSFKIQPEPMYPSKADNTEHILCYLRGNLFT